LILSLTCSAIKMAEKDRFEDLDVDGRIITKWTLNTWNGNMWARPLRIGKREGCCEHGNEPSGSKKCSKFLDYLRIVRARARALVVVTSRKVKGSKCVS